MYYAGVGLPARRFPEAWSLLYRFPACQRDALCDRAYGNRQLLDFVRNLALCPLRTTCCVVQLSFFANCSLMFAYIGLRIIRASPHVPQATCARFKPQGQ